MFVRKKKRERKEKKRKKQEKGKKLHIHLSAGATFCSVCVACGPALKPNAWGTSELSGMGVSWGELERVGIEKLYYHSKKSANICAIT